MRHVMSLWLRMFWSQTFVAQNAPSKAALSLVHVSVRGFVLRFACFMDMPPFGI